MSDINQLTEYIKLRDEILKLEEQIKYYSNLIRFAEENLPIDRLEEISKDLEIVARQRAFLSSQLNEMKTRLLEVAPSYVKIYEELKDYARAFFSLIINLRQRRLKILDAKIRIEEIISRIQRKLRALENALSEIEPIISTLKGHAKEVITIDITRIRKGYSLLNKACKVFSLTEKEAQNLQKIIGFDVFTKEERKLGFVNGICISPRTFGFYIEIADERKLTDEEIVLLFNATSLEYGASSKEDFINKLQKDAKRHLKLPPSEALKPSVIRKIFAIKSVSLSENITDILKPKHYVVGYYPVEKLQIIPEYRRVIVSSTNEIVKIRNPIPLPSAIRFPRSLIGKKIRDDEFYYTIIDIIWLPVYGWCFLTTRYKENEFAPSEKFLDKLYEEWNIISDKPVRIPKNYDEKHWGIKALITKALRTKEKIIMSEALKPRYVFLFCLKNGISLSYPQIFSAYLFLIPTYKVLVQREEIRPRIPLNPVSLFDIKNLFILIENILDLKDREIFGLLIARRDKRISLIVQLLDKLSEKEIDVIFTDKMIADDLKHTWRYRTSNIIPRLISLRLIKNISEYQRWLYKLGLKEIDWDKLLGNMYGDWKATILTAFSAQL